MLVPTQAVVLSDQLLIGSTSASTTGAAETCFKAPTTPKAPLWRAFFLFRSQQIGTPLCAGRSAPMQIFSYSVTDLTDYESPSDEILLDEQEVPSFAARVAREMLTAMPELKLKGMCLAVYNREGTPVVIAPLDPIQ